MMTKPIRVLGTMSGTSLDGVDAAVLETDGVDIQGFGDRRYRPYSEGERATLKAALGQWDGAQVQAAAQVVEAAHLALLSEFGDVDLVGFHGQTLAHAPRGRGTLQVGDGAVLARRLGTPVVWDFRSADVAAGGEGAPLAPFFHFACAKWMRAEAPLAFLNLGGVGNLTYVDPRFGHPEEPGALLAFDTGPANAPVNDLMQARRHMAFDKDGALAAQGQVNAEIVEAFLAHAYFRKPPPKSLDRNDFNAQVETVNGLGDAAAAATLTAFCAASVAQGLRACSQRPAQLLVTGGGRKNPTLMAMLQERLECPVRPVEAAGLDGDMLEAQAFAYLAARVSGGLPTSAPGTTGAPRPICGGVKSAPV